MLFCSAPFVLLYYTSALYNKILEKYGVTRTDYIFSVTTIAHRFQQDSSWYNWDLDNIILLQYTNFVGLLSLFLAFQSIFNAGFFREVLDKEIVKPAESTLPFVTILSTVLIPTVSTALYRYYRTNK